MLRTSLAALGTATVSLVSVWAVAASAGPMSPGSAVVGGTVAGGMSLVEQVSDRITVLNFGKKIAEGAPSEVLSHPDVITAYLGEGPAHAAA